MQKLLSQRANQQTLAYLYVLAPWAKYHVSFRIVRLRFLDVGNALEESWTRTTGRRRCFA